MFNNNIAFEGKMGAVRLYDDGTVRFVGEGNEIKFNLKDIKCKYYTILNNRHFIFLMNEEDYFYFEEDTKEAIENLDEVFKGGFKRLGVEPEGFSWYLNLMLGNAPPKN